MALSYNYSTSLITVPQADSQPLLIQTVVNSIRAQEASERGIVEPQIADATGKAPLGGGVYTGITLSLRDSWRLNFVSGPYQATIDGGNLSDALARINNTGSPQVLIRASAAATVIESGGSGSGSFPSVSDIAAGVWDEILESSLTARQVQLLIAAQILGTAIYSNGVWTYREDIKDTVFGSQNPLDKGISAANVDIKSTTVNKTTSSAGGVDRVVVSTKKLP